MRPSPQARKCWARLGFVALKGPRPLRPATARGTCRDRAESGPRGSARVLLIPGDMTVLEFVISLVVAGICGAIARAIAGGSRGGFVISVLVGFLGAFVGTWFARTLHLPTLLV